MKSTEKIYTEESSVKMHSPEGVKWTVIYEESYGMWSKSFQTIHLWAEGRKLNVRTKCREVNAKNVWDCG